MPAPRIFISYSRKDGTAFAAGLRKQLEAQNLSVWQDVVQMEAGTDWWSQIEAAVRHKDLEHFVLVVTPQALDRDGGKIIRQEIRLARPARAPALAGDRGLRAPAGWVEQRSGLAGLSGETHRRPPTFPCRVNP